MDEGRSDYDELIAPIELSMMRTVWNILRDADEADEAFQDALVQIWQKLSRIRAANSPHALILRICANSAVDRLRKRVRRVELQQEVSSETAASVLTPLECAESSETYSRILNAVGRLPRNQSIAIVMRMVQQESYSTIAAALNCGEATARKHVARGKARLQQLIADLL